MRASTCQLETILSVGAASIPLANALSLQHRKRLIHGGIRQSDTSSQEFTGSVSMIGLLYLDLLVTVATDPSVGCDGPVTLTGESRKLGGRVNRPTGYELLISPANTRAT